jgi:membrane protein YdbS with pleckstrin-like domain
MSRRRMLHVLNQTFWVLALGVICLFAFFLGLGAFSPSGAVGLSIAMVVLIALWVAHAMWQARHRSGRDEAAIRARERRGF